MRKAIGYLLTPLYLLCFGLNLVVFDLFQRIAYALTGYAGQQQMVYNLNWVAMRCIHLLGGSLKWDWNDVDVPVGRKLIFVANHQSMNDIPPMIWFLRRYKPIFIAKKELAKGIPSISYNYKCGGAIAIDRKDGAQARTAIMGLAKRLKTDNIGVCIFPEGTRARDGQLKKFQAGGLKTLLTEVPDAVIVPIAIANSWKLVRYGFWPVPAAIRLKFSVLPYIDGRNTTAEQIIEEAHQRIATQLAKDGFSS
jgi:1-acyl-sn-glycerol-3-phosphate acyltransferase